MHLRRFSRSAVMTMVSLASLGAADGPDGRARLADAVQHRDKEAVQSLLRRDPNVNARQADGATALHWAAHWGDVETAARLVRAGANVNARNDYGITPLSLAAASGNGAVIQRLLEAGADPNATVRQGETPLMAAARTGHVDAVTPLLAYRSQRQRDGNLERADGPDVGRRGGTSCRAADAARSRRRSPRAFEQRRHGAAVCRQAAGASTLCACSSRRATM